MAPAVDSDDTELSPLSADIFQQHLLLDKNSRVELHTLCGVCQRICSESRVLNNEEWHREKVMHEDWGWPLPGHAETGSSSLCPDMGEWPIDYFPESYVFHQTVESFLSSAQHGCHLCTILTRKVQTTHMKWRMSKFSWTGVQEKLKGGSFRLAIAWECDFSGGPGGGINYRLMLIKNSVDLESLSVFCRISLIKPEEPIKCIKCKS